MLRVRIGSWIKNQHQNNPHLPDLDYDEIGEIVDVLREEKCLALTIDKARDLTGYPIKNEHHEFFLTADGDWVIEAKKPTKRFDCYTVAAILTADIENVTEVA